MQVEIRRKSKKQLTIFSIEDNDKAHVFWNGIRADDAARISDKDNVKLCEHCEYSSSPKVVMVTSC